MGLLILFWADYVALGLGINALTLKERLTAAKSFAAIDLGNFVDSSGDLFNRSTCALPVGIL